MNTPTWEDIICVLRKIDYTNYYARFYYDREGYDDNFIVVLSINHVEDIVRYKNAYVCTFNRLIKLDKTTNKILEIYKVKYTEHLEVQ